MLKAPPYMARMMQKREAHLLDPGFEHGCRRAEKDEEQVPPGPVSSS
jgi:hypothetical protein